MRPPADVAISDLRERPEFADTVAERIWRAWWLNRGLSFDYLRERVAESCDSTRIPFALVAHRNREFLGTASVITSDLEERPALSPWVAAVWVDPLFRRQGIGGVMVDAAAQASFSLGFDRIFLCALPARAPFYAKRGWTEIERDVGDHALVVFERQR